MPRVNMIGWRNATGPDMVLYENWRKRCDFNANRGRANNRPARAEKSRGLCLGWLQSIIQRAAEGGKGDRLVALLGKYRANYLESFRV